MAQSAKKTGDIEAPSAVILVVDDVFDNVDVLSRRLARKGFAVDSCESGQEALDRIATRAPDMVLLDWMMPGLSGIEVLRKIRLDYSASHLPVIMTTARDEADAVVEAFREGANDYIVKPFEFDIVLARVKSQLERLQAIRALEALMAASPAMPEISEENLLGGSQLLREAIDGRKAAEASLRDALGRAEAGIRAKQSFLSNMCHELRTPLNAIIGFSQVLEGSVKETDKLFVEHIHGAGNHLLELLDSMIKMSELERQTPVIQKTDIRIFDLIENANAILRHAADQKKIHLNVVHNNLDNLTISADPVSLKQAYINIVSNAVKFSPDESAVTISLDRVDERSIAIVVEDEGIGVDADVAKSLGAPFERAPLKYSGEFGGVGAGLTIAKRLVEAHGGRIRLEARAPMGTRASLILPIR